MSGPAFVPEVEADGATAAAALHQNGLALLAQGQLVEAERAFKGSLSLRESIMTLFALAGVQWRLNALAATEQTLERLIDLGGLSANMEELVYLRLSKLKASRSDEVGAVEVLLRARALSPHNIQYILAQANLIATRDVARAWEVLEQLLQRPNLSDAQVSHILKVQTHHRAAVNRQRRGVSPTIAASWRDCLGWDDPAGLQRLFNATAKELGPKGGRVGAALNAGLMFALVGDWDNAEAMLAQIRGKHDTFANIAKLGKAHLAKVEAMTEAELRGDLVPVVELVAAPQAGPCLYLASDPVYYRTFTKPFLRALDEHGATCDVHVHLLDGDPALWGQEAIELASLTRRKVGLSAEASHAAAGGEKHARVYYHAVRFVRFYEALKRQKRPLWQLDVDVHLRGDPTALMAKLGDFDLALRGRACAFAPWSKLSACCVGVSPTPRGLDFDRMVAAYIMDAKGTGTWMWALDQMALFAAYVHFHRTGRAPTTWFLQDDVLSINNDGIAPFRFVSGVLKHVEQDV